MHTFAHYRTYYMHAGVVGVAISLHTIHSQTQIKARTPYKGGGVYVTRDSRSLRTRFVFVCEQVYIAH